jgi:hypothetical protein
MDKIFDGLGKGLYFLFIALGIYGIYRLSKGMLHQIDERKTITKDGKIYTAFLCIILSIGLGSLYSIMKEELDISGSFTGFIISLATSFVGRAHYYVERKKNRIEAIKYTIENITNQNNPQNEDILKAYRKKLREIENE